MQKFVGEVSSSVLFKVLSIIHAGYLPDQFISISMAILLRNKPPGPLLRVAPEGQNISNTKKGSFQ